MRCRGSSAVRHSWIRENRKRRRGFVLSISCLAGLLSKHGKLHSLIDRWFHCFTSAVATLVGFKETAEVEHLDLQSVLQPLCFHYAGP
jgi:hypothetical protein